MKETSQERVDILVVVAHPDDESLGCGGTIAKASLMGQNCAVLVLSGEARARTYRPSDEQLRSDFIRAMGCLGVDIWELADFPNIQFNTVAHLELVQTIEDAVCQYRPKILITHHPGDLNDDHRFTADAALVASRLPQRSEKFPAIEQVLLMETPSATEWGFHSRGPRFTPNFFVELGGDMLDRKLQAINCYGGVPREFPHPRSTRAIRALATLRGAESGLDNAEAFELVFSIRT